MAGTNAFTVILSALDALLKFVSLTCAVKLLAPVAVGVPEITPVLVFSDRPVGKEPEVIDHV